MRCVITIFLCCIIATFCYGQNQQKHNDATLLDYYQAHRYTDAFNYLQSTYNQPVDDVKINSLLAYTAQMSGRLPQAESYYLRILQHDSTNITVLYNLGNLNIRRGNNRQAEYYYKKILSADSTNFNVYRQLSTLAKNNGDIAAAIIYLQRANQINPVDADVAYDLADYYLALNQPNAADAAVSTALQADTGNLLLVLAKAKICYQLDKADETVALCKTLVDAGDLSYKVISMLAISHFALKQYPECITVFSTLSNTDTHTEASWYYTAMSYKALKNYKEAIKAFNHALEKAISPSTDSYYAEKADVYEKRGMPKTAAANYLKALEYNQRPITLYLLATLYDDKIKANTNALRYYKRYLATRPPASQKQYVEFATRRVKELSR